jgi:hypothetical protein
MINEPTFTPVVANLTTTDTSVVGVNGRYQYIWKEMTETWANSTFSWDSIKLQKPPMGTAVTNLPI